ncbi:MAG: DHHA1 domain-containing protein [Thermoplasmata archaeon]|nr:DHHA1 domain-containing protein [Thermoplasmata archaeon]
MPSGPDGFVSDPAYGREFTKAREVLLAHPGRWRVIYHYDGDGIASACSLVRMLERLGYPPYATPLQGVERERMHTLLQGTHGPVIVVDTGASWLDLYPPHPHPVIVLDHHQYEGAPRPPELPAHVAFVNPVDWGVDGMREMCAATLSWLFSVFVDPVNWDNAPWGLSGGIADRQHVGGFSGLNATLVNEAVQRSLIQKRPGLALFGPTLGEAVTRSIDPFVKGLSGRPEAVTAFLQSIDLDPKHETSGLDAGGERRLHQALLAKLVRQGVRPEFLESLRRERYRLPSLGVDGEELSNWQNALGRAAEPGRGIALALGDPSAWDAARRAENAWRTAILTGMRRVEDGGVNSLSAIQWFESAETTYAGTQAGLAMNYLVDPTRPLVVFSAGQGVWKVSGRGTTWLVSRGLDLAVALRAAASAVGGEGGGHKVASGATIPTEGRPKFLEETNRIVAEQLPRTEVAA